MPAITASSARRRAVSSDVIKRRNARTCSRICGTLTPAGSDPVRQEWPRAASQRGFSLSQDRHGAYAVKINICRPGTVAAACTLTDAAVPVGGSQPCRPKQGHVNRRRSDPAMTTYPVEFHRRSERQWARRAQASRSSELRSSELMPSPRSVRAYGSQPAAERPDFSISLLFNRSTFTAAESAKKCRT
jgi:hypothetical protein